MKWARLIYRQCVRLFIDDGRLAVAILVWLSLLWLLLPKLPSIWRAPLLPLGLLVILFESVLRRSRGK